MHPSCLRSHDGSRFRTAVEVPEDAPPRLQHRSTRNNIIINELAYENETKIQRKEYF